MTRPAGPPETWTADEVEAYIESTPLTYKERVYYRRVLRAAQKEQR